MDELRMPFTAHLEELRRRLILCASVVFGVFAVLFLGFQNAVFRLFTYPMTRAFAIAGLPEAARRLHTKEPTEIFFAQMKLSFLAAILIGVPVIAHQAWRFVAPGLYHHERKAALPFVLAATVAFATGASFCFFVVLPYGYAFLLGYAIQAGVEPTLMVSEYVSGTIGLLLAFGAVFELPVVVGFIARLGLITGEKLAKGRGFAVVGAFVVGAILTPPDVITQFMLAVPLCLLYELSILAARIMSRKRKERQRVTAEASGLAG